MKDTHGALPEPLPAISVRGLSMHYGATPVLDNMSFEVRRGEVVALLGPNGAGKTTTLEILEGFRGRSAGDVTVLGVDPDHADQAWQARIGLVLQSWRDHGKWRVRELLDYLAGFYRPYGTVEIPRPRAVDEVLAMVGLTDRAAARIGTLSGGQRRRMDVAIGIIGRPEVLFLDEPTAGFDPEARRDFHDLIHSLSDLEDTTIMLTTHDLDEAEKLADRILILAGGHIIADGTADQLAGDLVGADEVRWSVDGRRHVHSTTEPARFVHDLYRQFGDAILDLEVRRGTLEDSYMTLVRENEAASASRPLTAVRT